MYAVGALLCASLLISVCNGEVQSTPNGANEIKQMQKSRSATASLGSLYPQATETRDLRTLDGIWNFRKQEWKTPMDPEYGVRNGWFETDLRMVGSWFWGLFSERPVDVYNFDVYRKTHPGFVNKWFKRDLSEVPI